MSKDSKQRSLKQFFAPKIKKECKYQVEEQLELFTLGLSKGKIWNHFLL